MKKKLFMLALAICLILPTALCFVGCATKPEQCHIYVSSEYSSYGSAYGTGTYAKGEKITIVAVPNEGYKFVEWSDGNTDSARKITVDYDKTYTAYFEHEGNQYCKFASVNLSPYDISSNIDVILLHKFEIKLSNYATITCFDSLGAGGGDGYGVVLFNRDDVTGVKSSLYFEHDTYDNKITKDSQEFSLYYTTTVVKSDNSRETKSGYFNFDMDPVTNSSADQYITLETTNFKIGIQFYFYAF